MKTVDKSKSPEMFNKIAHKYDFVNRVLSFGIDLLWRRRLTKLVASKKPYQILDVATGTGDVLIALAKKTGAEQLSGLDPSQGMLDVAQKKIEKQISGKGVTLINASAHEIPLPDNQFDVITIAFGIRNIPDPERALKEMHRVLRPGGYLYVLEFSLPKNKLVRMLHFFYLRNILPVVGGLITGNRSAYSYLDKTIEVFSHGAQFGDLLKEAGFSDVEYYPQTFGIATIYQSKKI